MKNLKKLFIYSLLSLGLVFLQSCQEEELDVIDNTDTENITSNSLTANLMIKTSSNDGSFDNILDNASCISIVFPVTVKANGITITIENKEGLNTVEQIFDALDTDTDMLEISFPITVEMADYETIVIENKEALVELAKQCVEEGKDEDIECIDFVYPITFDKLDLRGVKTSQLIVESDKQMRRMFKSLNNNELVSIHYPIQLRTAEGEIVDVQDNQQLIAAIQQFKELCDEDDDNDYNDDDFKPESLRGLLKSCEFKITKVVRNNQENTDQYESWKAIFMAEDVLKIKNASGTVMLGTWQLVKENYKLILKTTVADASDFSGSWVVCELGDNRIKLFEDDNNKVYMKRLCEEEPDGTSIAHKMKTCKWAVKNLENNEIQYNELIGYQLQFGDADVVMVYQGATQVDSGTWKLSKIEEKWYVDLNNFSVLEKLNMNLPIYDIKEERLKLYNGDGSEIRLEKNCDNDANDGDVGEITDALMTYSWKVTKFEENGDPNDGYAKDIFSFTDSYDLKVYDTEENLLSAGFWLVHRNSYGQLEMMLNFATVSNYYPMANDWKIVDTSESTIVLKHHNGGDNYSYLTFTKKE